MWFIAAALMPATGSEAGEPEQSQEGMMQMTEPNNQGRTLSPDDLRTVAPALEAYTQERLYGDVWKRPGLTPRDRSLITIAALIGRDQAAALAYYLNQAIENGSSHARSRRRSRTWRSTLAGPMHSRPLALRKMSSHNAALASISSPRRPCNCCRSTRPRSPNARSASASSSAPSHRGSSNTPQTCC